MAENEKKNDPTSYLIFESDDGGLTLRRVGHQSAFSREAALKAHGLPEDEKSTKQYAAVAESAVELQRNEVTVKTTSRLVKVPLRPLPPKTDPLTPLTADAPAADAKAA